MSKYLGPLQDSDHRVRQEMSDIETEHLRDGFLPVPWTRSLPPDVWDVGHVRRLLVPNHAVALGFGYHSPNGRESDVDGRRRQGRHSGLPLHQQGPGERLAGTELEQVIQSFGVVAQGVGRLDASRTNFRRISCAGVRTNHFPSLLSSGWGAKTSSEVIYSFYF
jgi:hypothetical protein